MDGRTDKQTDVWRSDCSSRRAEPERYCGKKKLPDKEENGGGRNKALSAIIQLNLSSNDASNEHLHAN